MSKGIEEILAELLYRHNCVIIPGLGGFVANYTPAYLQDERQTVHPSCKRIAFNQSLTDNDGLLINALAKDRSIGFEEAELLLQSFKTDLLEKLAAYRNYEIRNIGTLYLKPEGKLLFVPYYGQNFLDRSYGLPSVKLRPLPALAQNTAKTSEGMRKKLLARKPKREQTVDPAKKSKERFWLNAAATASSVFGIILLGFIGLFVTRNQGKPAAQWEADHSASNAMSEVTEQASAFGLLDSPTQLPTDESIIDELYPPIHKEMAQQEEKRLTETDTVSKETKPQLETLLTEYRNSSRQRFVYHVVCLKTRDLKEAKLKADELKSSQYNAVVLDHIKAGWYYLSAEQLYNEQSAEEFASLLKQSEKINTEIIKLSLSQ